MKKTITLADKKFAHIPGLVWLLEKFFYVPTLNRILKNTLDKSTPEKILTYILHELNATYQSCAGDLARIPTSGPTIIVANHPYGIIDAIAVLSEVLKVRKDVKMVTNFLINEIPPMQPFIINVDPFKTKKWANITALGIKQTNQFLEEGGALIIFPAGVVSHWRWKEFEISDSLWKFSAAKFAIAHNATVVPIYCSGRNRWYFHLAGIISPHLRTLLLPQQSFSKIKRHFILRIGNPIPVAELKKIGDLKKQIHYLRLRTYLLAYQSPPNKKTKIKKLNPHATKPIDINLLRHDLEHLSTSARLIDISQYTTYFAYAHEIPNILMEIGRLREIAFTAIGEGTGQSKDLDKYDQQYGHLFVWDKKEEKVVGSYRLGLTNKIIPKFGISGMYVSSLFRLTPTFFNHLHPSIELGRSFVALDYQKKTLPLLLLWKGVFRFFVNNPEYISLYGAVSISPDYQPLSKDVMIYFLERYHKYTTDSVLIIKDKNSYPIPEKIPKIILELIEQKPDMDTLNSIIRELEHDHKGIPVLLRQYVSTMGGYFVGYSLDPNFKNTLDCVALAFITDMPHRRLAYYMSKEGFKNYLKYQDENHE